MSNIKAYWSKSKAELEKSEGEFNELLNRVRRDTGKNDQLEKEINEALLNVKYKKKFFSIEPDDEILKNQNISYILPIHAGTAAYTSASLVTARQEFEENLAWKDEWYSKYQYSFSSSTGDYEFNDIVMEVSEISQNPQLNNFEPIKNKQISRTEILKRLQNELKNFDNEFVDLLDYSEQNIISKEGGWIGSSVNSTVELIDRFLRSNAPNNQIKIQDWFIPNKEAKNGITRIHRVEFFLRQKIGSPIVEAKKEIEYWGDEIKYSISKLQKIKHSMNNSDQENTIVDKIDYARLVLLNIILYQR